MAGIIGGAWWISLRYGCVDSVDEWAVDWCASGHFHAGIDLAADCGLAIYATRAGPWSEAGRATPSLGGNRSLIARHSGPGYHGW
jgi:murein DD-endopeptidase MepM/ murein hydrolase activator NlpD